MTREPRPDVKSSSQHSRELRLKAALKANMGRRKAQARARAADENSDEDDEKPGDATEADKEME